MKTKQTIAIIGATSNIGATICRSLSKGNYRLLLFANELHKVKALAQQIKAEEASAEVEEMDCQIEAAWEADIIILAVPFDAEEEVAEKIKEMANQKIVISIVNTLNSTDDGLATTPGTDAAEELQKLLPNSKVVKAFHTTSATNLSTPVIDVKQLDALLANDDKETIQIIAELADWKILHH